MTSVPHPAVEPSWLPRGRLLLLPVHLVVAALVVVTAAVAIAARVYEPADASRVVTVVTGLAVIGLTCYTRYGLGFPWVSASVAYLVLFWLFHFGLAFTAVVRPSVLDGMQDWEIAWMSMPNVRLTLLLAALGAAGFVCGAAWFAPGADVARVDTFHDGDPTLHRAGWVLLLGGLAASAFLLARYGGAGVLSMGYIEFTRDVLDASALPIAMDLVELGCLMAICGAELRRCVTPLAAWAPFGALLLLLGLRNEVMVPLATFAIVLTHRGVYFRRAVVLAALAALLIVIPAIKNFRLVGFSNRAEVSWAEESPLAALTELGGTLRAATSYVDWIEDGDDYQWGAGYWAPIDRQILVRLMPWRTAPQLDEDPRIPSRNITSVGSVGLSATGEAYYNFGVFGPFLFYGCVGALLAWLERRAFATPYRAAMLGIAMLVLFFNIRSSWLAVPGRAGMALAVIAACHVLGRRRREHLRNTSASPTA